MSILKWGALAVALLWTVAAGWGELSKAELPDNFRSAAYKRQAEKCEGSFESRYECKSHIIINNDSSTFNDWVLRLAIVFGPSILIWVLYSRVQDRRERLAEEERERRAVAQLKRIRAEQEELRRIHEATRRTIDEAVNHGTDGRPA
ncbi:MAG: hypothetical protein ACM3N5_14915 [Candidatus Eiseniibacteriota bacterium]